MRTLIQFLTNEVYHYIENGLHVLMSHSVEPVGVLHAESKVMLVHNLLFGFHIHWLSHISHDFFKIKRLFFLFIRLFCGFIFALIFFVNCFFQYFLNFKFETNLILSIQYSLVKSRRRCNLAYCCTTCILFPEHRHKSICSNIERCSFFLSKFLKSVICTFVPVDLTLVPEIFFIVEL